VTTTAANSGAHDQNILGSMLPGLAWKIKIWDLETFTNGCVVKFADAVNMKTKVTLHVNCIWGAQEKVDLAKRLKVWLVDESGTCMENPKWATPS